MPQKRILLIEDNEDDIILIVRALERNAFTLQYVLDVVRDGEAALDHLEKIILQRGRLPDLILLDLRLPRLPGLEVVRYIRRTPLFHLLPVVMLTSSVEQEDLLASYQTGVNSYIRKPGNAEDFTSTVQQIGTYWLTVNEKVQLL